MLHGSVMSKGRMEAYSDAVIAIIMTIMVLELRPPEGTDWTSLQPLVPVFLTYVLSFVCLGIHWNNHHHLLQATTHITGGIPWANLNLLFWLSPFPFATGWMGENRAAIARPGRGSGRPERIASRRSDSGSPAVPQSRCGRRPGSRSADRDDPCDSTGHSECDHVRRVHPDAALG